MINYQSFQYIFPPRPKNAVPPKDLLLWDNGTMVAQPKINGSNCTIYTDGTNVYVFNRHGQRMSNFDIDKNEILRLYSGQGWMVLNGEYTNKGKKDQFSNYFTNKFCLFDILVYDGKYLVNSTFQSRVDLISELFGTHTDYLFGLSDNVYLINNFYKDFYTTFENLTLIDLVEGLVLKRKNGKLEIGTSENNNTKNQIKARKPTKNYKF